MKRLTRVIFICHLLVYALVAPVGAEDGLPGIPADSVSNDFFALESVQAEALSDEEMAAIRGGVFTFTLTLSDSLPPSVPGVNLNLAVPASNLPQLEPAKDHCFTCSLCFNCFIIPG